MSLENRRARGNKRLRKLVLAQMASSPQLAHKSEWRSVADAMKDSRTGRTATQGVDQEQLSKSAALNRAERRNRTPAVDSTDLGSLYVLADGRWDRLTADQRRIWCTGITSITCHIPTIVISISLLCNHLQMLRYVELFI